jgi:GT2 family glycosyltransferase
MGLMTVSVVIPTYMRPQRLEAALRSAWDQKPRPADEVIVVCRNEDEGARRVAAAYPGTLTQLVEQPGVLAAMRVGAGCATGSVIAFLDDDAEPPEDWLDAALRALEDPVVGAYSARDVVRDPDDEPRRPDVGRITRWGKLIGNHHLAVGAARDVDVLKGANLVFRREALQLPADLRGAGAQVHYEVATCLAASAAGWRLRFDPNMAVRHLPGDRFDSDRRGAPAPDAVFNAAYNLVFTLVSFRPELFWRRALFGLLVGDRATPGLVRGLVALVQRETRVLYALRPSVAGQLAALRDLRRGRRVMMTAFGGHRRQD